MRSASQSRWLFNSAAVLSDRSAWGTQAPDHVRSSSASPVYQKKFRLHLN